MEQMKPLQYLEMMKEVHTVQYLQESHPVLCGTTHENTYKQEQTEYFVSRGLCWTILFAHLSI